MIALVEAALDFLHEWHLANSGHVVEVQEMMKGPEVICPMNVMNTCNVWNGEEQLTEPPFNSFRRDSQTVTASL